MAIKEGIRAILVNARGCTASDRSAEPRCRFRACREFDYIDLFARTQAELDAVFPKLKAHLKPRGML
jgi:hypothetical protein